MNQDDPSNGDKEKEPNSNEEKNAKEKKAIKRSKSFDIRSMFRAKSKLPDDDEVTANLNEFATPPPLNRNHSQPESSKLDTIRKSILQRTQSVKKTTADFFGVNKEHEDEDYQLWLEKRKRYYMKAGSKLKEKEKADAALRGTDTNDSQHVGLFTSGDFEPSANFAVISGFTLPKPSVMQLAKKGIRSMQQEKSKKTSSVAGYDPSPAIHMKIMKSAEPQEVMLNQQFGFDDTAEDQTEANLQMQHALDASEFLPNDLIFSYELPRTPTKTWTIVDRKGRQRINSKLIESIYDNSDRRQYGMGILGKLLNRRFRKNLTKEEKDLLNSVYDSRPYFTYWIMCVQFVIMILALATYGFGPIGLQKVKISQPVLVNSLSIQEVSYFEPNNIWLGPRPADLIHLGAKFTPCMRKDKLIFDEIEKEREEEKDTACCIRTDRSGCIQTKKDRCSPLLSTWKKWSASDNITYIKENRQAVRTSGSVCGQDPRYCLDPKSWFPNVWADDITKWPICKQKKPIRNGHLNQDPHMSCNLIGKPCCIGIHGECKITTKDYCDFVKGFFHEEATLCSQVSCMSDVCGMLQIKRDDNLLQIYRLFTSLFLHAGLIHIAVSFAFQYYIMRDFEKLFGSFRLLLLYMLSGMGGNLASAIFVPYRAEVGPGGSQFGVLAGLVAEQIHSWNLIEDPTKQLLKLIGIAGVLFVYGVFPWIDNYAHIFGFVIGFLLSLALLPFLTFTAKVRRKLKIILICICSAIVLVIFIVLLLLLYKYPIYECKYCSYLNCIPFTADWCSDHTIEIKRKDIL